MPISEEIQDTARGLHSNVASIWPVSISEGNAATTEIPKIMTSLGGKKLNPDGIPVDDNSISEIKSSISKLGNKLKVDLFLKWLLEFPGTRSDSPFREDHSPEYLLNLIQQDNLVLLNEALRIQRNDPLL